MRSLFMLLVLAIISTTTLSFAGLDAEDQDDYNHTSLGADVFPYDWFIRLKSARERELTGTWDVKLKEKLDERANVIYDQGESKYISGVTGLSVTWSGHAQKNPAALKSDPEFAQTRIGEKPPMRTVDGVPSIRMLGTTCAACHTGNLKTATNNYIIPGGQSNLSLDWLLRDMVVSTLGLMFNVEDQLTEFLVSFGYGQKEAAFLANKFKKDTLKEFKLTTKLGLAAKQLKIIAALPSYIFVKEEKSIHNRLKALLRLTLHMKEDEELGNELDRRMGFIAMLASGTPRKTFKDQKWSIYKEVHSGFGRVDAFNNAFNKLLRNKNEKINLSAPVGFPPIWGIQNKYLLHYTGNTNSIMYRNIGLASAGGALILNDELDSTVHMENLFKLENLIYKINPPVWQEVFQTEEAEIFKIKPSRVARGHEIFMNKCMGCHSPKKTHSDFIYPLYEYPVVSQKKLGTDPQLSQQIVKPLHPLEDEKSYPAQVYLARTRGLLEGYFKKFNISKSDQDKYAFKKHRGNDQWFRDTKVEDPGSSYLARDLAGSWATAPFLHNNSVPTLWDLLQKPSKRPKMIRIKDREFDPKKVGLKGHDEDLESCHPRSKRDYQTDIHQCIDTTIIGSSNSGHDFGTDLTNEEKYDLIEYLKVIQPYSESRAPSSVDADDTKSPTPFLDDFDNIKVGKIPLIGKYLEKKDFLKHQLLTFKKWTVESPDQMFKELREYKPIVFISKMPIRDFGAENKGVAIVSKHEDIIEVLGNPADFSVRHVGYKLDPLGGYMLGTDLTEINEKEKPWLRKLMPKEDYARIGRLIHQFTDESFKNIEKAQAGSKTIRMNIVKDLGRRIPAQLFEKYFGFSGPTLEHLYKWSYWIQKDTFRNPMNQAKVRKKALKAEFELLAEMNKFIAQLEKDLKKNGGKPINDTVLERMILSEEIQNGTIKKDRIAINMIGLIGASIDTVQIALVKTVEFFTMNPDLMKEAKGLVEARDVKKLQKYIIESLRLRPVGPLLIRYAERDTVIAKGTPRETTVPKGTSLLLGIYSGMRDPDAVPNPDKFDPTRPENAYLMFGYGHHKCVGDRLSEVELGIMMSTILQKNNIKYTDMDKPGLTFPEERWIEYDAN